MKVPDVGLAPDENLPFAVHKKSRSNRKIIRSRNGHTILVLEIAGKVGFPIDHPRALGLVRTVQARHAGRPRRW